MIEFFPSFQTFIRIFGIDIQWYAIFILTGAYIAYRISLYNFKKSPFYQPEILSDFFFQVLIIGIIGARIWFILFSDIGYYLSNPIEMLNIRGGGLAVQGGLVAGISYGYYFCRKHRLPFLAMADMIVPNILLAQVMGRWGNFMNQEAFGGVTTKAFLQSIMIPNFIIDHMYIQGQYHHPTFLYEGIGNLIAFLIIIFVIKRIKKRRTGDLVASFLILGGIVRFFVEGMRTDSLMLGPIRMAQLTSIVFILLGIALLIYVRVMMKKKPLILFDLDGTLLNTFPLISESYKHVFKKYKPEYELTEEDLISFNGPSLHTSFSRFFESEQIEQLITDYREHNLSSHEQFASVYPGVEETLQQLKNQGYQIGIVTTKLHDGAQHGLAVFDLLRFADIIIGSDDVREGKPSPEGVLKAMHYLNAKTAIMIGDNETDILAGKAAGVKAYGVSWSIKTKEELMKANPDGVLESMSDLMSYLDEEVK